MKHIMTLSFSALVAAGLFALGFMPSVHAGQELGCSNATYEGDYIFSGHGSTVVEGVTQPFAFIGRLTADGKGNFSGSGTSSLNGQIIHRTYEATYTIKSDCTAYYEGTDDTGQRFQGEFVLAGPSGKRYRGVRTLPGQTIVFTGEKE